MKMKIGPELERGIILKYRRKLKAVLAEHEVKSSDTEHMILLGDMIRLVEERTNKTDIPWYDGDL